MHQHPRGCYYSSSLHINNRRFWWWVVCLLNCLIYNFQSLLRCAKSVHNVTPPTYKLSISWNTIYTPLRFNGRYCCLFSLYPRFNEVERGVYWFHLVHMPVCPSVDRIVSTLYLQQYSSDPFHICTSYQAMWESVSCKMPVSKFKNSKFGEFFKFVTLTLSSFDLGSNMTQWNG